MLYASLSNIAQLKERWRTLSDLGIYVRNSAGVAGLQYIHTGNGIFLAARSAGIA
jgi:hypothetical protein